MRWDGRSRIMFGVNKNEEAFSPRGCGKKYELTDCKMVAGALLGYSVVFPILF